MHNEYSRNASRRVAEDAYASGCAFPSVLSVRDPPCVQFAGCAYMGLAAEVHLNQLVCVCVCVCVCV